MLDTTTMIRVIELPGFRRVEDMVRLYYRPNQAASPEIDEMVSRLSQETFGIVMSDFVTDNGVVGKAENVEAFLEYYDDVGNSDEDAALVLKRFGLDFNGDDGWPLACTRFFKWQALAAATNFAGRLPDPEEAGARRLASSLEAEAQKFMDKKRSR